MEENRSLLQQQYCDYHSNSASGITEELLVKQSREFLTAVKPADRFLHLNIDFYEVLKSISENFETNEASIKKIKTGFHSLEKYGINLWKFPWRKEYHTIKLYTAFFKCNIEQQLQDPEAIFEILKSLGYTVRGQQEVSNKEPDKERAIWMSLELFLVQVDLQVIKEIMDRLPENGFTLRNIVRVRSKTRDVDDAINYLERKVAKRQRLGQQQGGDGSSRGHTKDTHIGRIDVFNKLPPDTRRSDAVASADQSTSRREDVAVDTDNSSTGSVVSKRQFSVAAPTGYELPSRNTGGRYFTSMNTEQFGQITLQDLYGVSPGGSQPDEAGQYNVDSLYSTVPQPASPYEAKQHLDPRYSTVPQAGPSQHSDYSARNLRYHTVPQAGRAQYSDNTKDRMDSAARALPLLSHHRAVPPMHSSHHKSSQSQVGSVRYDRGRYDTVHSCNEVKADTNGYQFKKTTTTETKVHGSASGDARYANLPVINSSAHQKFGSNESDKQITTKDSARGHDDRSVKLGQSRDSCAEPMEVEQAEYSRENWNDATSPLYNGITEGAHARPTYHAGVTDLNATLKYQLTLEASARIAGKGSKHGSIASTEHRRQNGSETRVGTSGEAQPSRLPFQNESNFTYTEEVGQKTRSGATDATSNTAVKVEVKGSSPVPSWRTPEQRERAQNPGPSSRNDLHSEISQGGSVLPKDVRGDATYCDMCGLQGTIICMNCHRIICRKCREIYLTDLCGATKGQHAFMDLKDNKRQQMKSVDSNASSQYANVNEGFVDDDRDWSCSRCTFLNPPDHKICAMCATTRGVGPVELTQAGRRVCRECTFHNEETETVCTACHKTMDLQNPETSV